MFLLRQIKKRFAIKSYVMHLPLIIEKKYGKHKRYTEKWVTDCVKSAGLNLAHISYAWAIFLGREEYNALQRKNPFLGDYDILRREVGTRFFNGKTDFEIHDIFGDTPKKKVKQSPHSGVMETI